MSAGRVLLAIPELALLLGFAPLLLSVITKVKAWFAGRVGPPWLQPYYDLYKLVQKGAVYSRTTTWVFRAGPLVNLAAVLTAALLVPVFAHDALLGFSGDVILLAYLLALGRMFTVLAALDTGSSFEGMGAAREVTFGTLSEPALFLSLVVMTVATRSLELGEMLGPRLGVAWGSAAPAMLLVVAALLIVLLTETCRMPVDDPTTHLELTMIHEVMVLDHSGPDLAAITYAAALKFTLFASLLVHAAFPHAGWPAWTNVPLRLVELVGVAAVVGVIESTTARVRLRRVPLLLAGATVLAGLGVVLILMRSPA